MAFVEDTAPFFSDLGVAATVGGASVRGIFDSAYADVFDQVDGVRPSLLCDSSDVAAAAHGTSVVIGSTSYTVASVQPDGTGLTRLILKASS